MVRWSKRAWKRWSSWSLPTKIGVAVGIVGTGLTSIGFYFVDVKPVLIRWIWPTPKAVVPNIQVRVKNSRKTDAAISYRGDLVLWLPDAMYDGTPRVGGRYEIVASDAGLVRPGLVTLPFGRETRLILHLMDQERLYQYLKRGDTDLNFIFRLEDGRSFLSDQLPFTEGALKKYYTRANIDEH
jgi:hypothetical protein